MCRKLQLRIVSAWTTATNPIKQVYVQVTSLSPLIKTLSPHVLYWGVIVPALLITFDPCEGNNSVHRSLARWLGNTVPFVLGLRAYFLVNNNSTAYWLRYWTVRAFWVALYQTPLLGYVTSLDQAIPCGEPISMVIIVWMLLFDGATVLLLLLRPLLSGYLMAQSKLTESQGKLAKLVGNIVTVMQLAIRFSDQTADKIKESLQHGVMLIFLAVVFFAYPSYGVFVVGQALPGLNAVSTLLRLQAVAGNDEDAQRDEDIAMEGVRRWLRYFTVNAVCIEAVLLRLSAAGFSWVPFFNQGILLVVVALQFPGLYLADKWFAYASNNRKKILYFLRSFHRMPSAINSSDDRETKSISTSAHDESTNDGEGVSRVNGRDVGDNVDSSCDDMINNVNED